MATDVSICSNALLMNGAQTINALDDDSDRARACTNLYPLVRDYVLASHPWSCARKRVQLSPDADALGALVVPPFDWNLQYSLPSDYLRILALGERGLEYPFEIEDSKLLTDCNPVNLRYVYRNENPGKWHPLLVMAATLAMRQVLAYPITQSTSLEQLIDQAIEPTLRRARAIDSQEEPPETLGDFRLLGSRFLSVNGRAI